MQTHSESTHFESQRTSTASASGFYSVWQTRNSVELHQGCPDLAGRLICTSGNYQSAYAFSLSLAQHCHLPHFNDVESIGVLAAEQSQVTTVERLLY